MLRKEHLFNQFGVIATFALTALLTACASDSANTMETEASSISVHPVSAAESAVTDEMYQLLTAELAGQSGQFDLALDSYLKVLKNHPDPAIAARAAQIAFFLKKYQEALSAAQIWVTLDPGDTNGKRMLGLLYLKTGNRTAAVNQLLDVTATSGKDTENALIELVKILDAEFSQEDGLFLLKALSEQRPKQAEYHLAYALLAANHDLLPLAFEEIQVCQRLQPASKRGQLLQAEILSRMGDSPQSRTALLELIRKDPKNPRLRMVYSQYLAKSGELKEARAQLNHIIAQDRNNQEARFGLALLDMESGHSDTARKTFTLLAKEARWRPQAGFYLGLMDARNGDMDAAVNWFDQVNSGSLEFEARVNAITARITEGKLDDARNRMQQIRASYPAEATRFYLLEAELLTRAHNNEAAYQLLNHALEKQPGQAELLYARALVAEPLGHYDVMESDLRAVITQHPDDPGALNALGYTLADRNEHLDEAERYLTRALALKPDDAAIEDSFGWVQFRLGHLERAEAHLKHAYTKVQDPEIGVHLAHVLLQSGRRAQALELLRAIKAKTPDNEDVKRLHTQYPELEI